MEIKTIIQQIKQLPLDKRFFVMEQTLKSIKHEELNNNTDIVEHYDDDDKFIYAINENSLGKDWLSKEDSRWDNLL